MVLVAAVATESAFHIHSLENVVAVFASVSPRISQLAFNSFVHGQGGSRCCRRRFRGTAATAGGGWCT